MEPSWTVMHILKFLYSSRCWHIPIPCTYQLYVYNETIWVWS